MIKLGNEMAMLRSQSGNSVAEHYYKLHGEIYVCFGSAISAFAGIILIAGIALAFLVLLLYRSYHLLR